jgi:hypothetical protein
MLLLNSKKCEFEQQSLVYLGFKVGGGALKIDPMKIEFIMTWPRLSNVMKLYGRYSIPSNFKALFSEIMTPLHVLTFGS